MCVGNRGGEAAQTRDGEVEPNGSSKGGQVGGMTLIGAVTGGAWRAATGTSSCAAATTNAHHNARLRPVLDRE